MLLDLIARRKARILEDFYDLGAALRELLDKKLYAALGYASFDDLLAKRDVIGRTQAYKLIAVVRELPRDRAVEVGQERAYALVAVAAATPEPDTAASILATGVKVHGKTKDVSKLSKRDLAGVAKDGRPHKTSAGEKDARAAGRKAQQILRARKVHATVTVEHAKGAWWAVVRVPLDKLDALSDGVGRR
ncbi:hypothetical protein BH09MYX1_BH09MYX1_37540 [soil metagenome]